MSNTINYVTTFENKIRELYVQALTSDDLFHSNEDINIHNTKDIKIPTLSVSGYKDHSRSSMSFNSGSYNNAFETKTLAHDRDIEFGVDPLDVDETDMISCQYLQQNFLKYLIRALTICVSRRKLLYPLCCTALRCFPVSCGLFYPRALTLPLM